MLTVGGFEYYSDSVNDVRSLRVIGSADDDTFTVAGDLGIPVTVDGGAGTNTSINAFLESTKLFNVT